MKLKKNYCLFFISLFILYCVDFKYKRKLIKSCKTEAIRLSRSFNLEKSGFIHKNINSMYFPMSLCCIPMGEDTGVVLDVKEFLINSYNSSIISHNDGFLIFFRYDELYYDQQNYDSKIGYIELDKNLNQIGKGLHKVIFDNADNEDPRVFYFKDKKHLLWNTLNDKGYRVMKMTEIDQFLGDIFVSSQKEIVLDLKKNKVEKNWVPFSYNVQGKEKLAFKYSIGKNENVFLEGDFGKEKLKFSSMDEFTRPDHHLWKWGEIRGGTPALLIEDQYLAFFHSSFKCGDGSSWYVMGAYTFQKEYPFKITGISPYPIFFKGIYNSHVSNLTNPLLRCVFPSGFTIRKKEGKELIYLSVGENDTSTKILIIDKDNLLNELVKIHYKERG